MRRQLPLLALMGLGFLLLVAAIPLAASYPVAAALVFAAGTVLGIGAEALLRRRPVIDAALSGFGFGLTVRTGLRGILLGALAAVWSGDQHDVMVVVATTL